MNKKDMLVCIQGKIQFARCGTPCTVAIAVATQQHAVCAIVLPWSVVVFGMSKPFLLPAPVTSLKGPLVDQNAALSKPWQFIYRL